MEEKIENLKDLRGQIQDSIGRLGNVLAYLVLEDAAHSYQEDVALAIRTLNNITVEIE